MDRKLRGKALRAVRYWRETGIISMSEDVSMNATKLSWIERGDKVTEGAYEQYRDALGLTERDIKKIIKLMEVM